MLLFNLGSMLLVYPAMISLDLRRRSAARADLLCCLLPESPPPTNKNSGNAKTADRNNKVATISTNYYISASNILRYLGTVICNLLGTFDEVARAVVAEVSCKLPTTVTGDKNSIIDMKIIKKMCIIQLYCCIHRVHR